MQTINLYRYTRPDGGVTTSPVQPDVPYELRYRLIADEGKMLTDGINITCCVDTGNPNIWTEIDEPEDPEIE